MQNPLALSAGILRHKITIQAMSSQPDSFGQPQQSWTPVLATRAAINAVLEREMYQPGQFTAQVTHTITLRWPGATIAIAPGMQVVYGAHTYKIQACNNIGERNRVLKLICLELNGAE